jgi:hypothetical protein
MTAVHPTVGLLIAVESATVLEAVQRLQRSLRGLIDPESWSRSDSSAFAGKAAVAGVRRDVRLWSAQAGDASCVFLDFDEDELIHTARDQGRSALQLLHPFLETAQSCPGVVLVGAGFELSVPSDLSAESLREVGVAYLVARAIASGEWEATDLGPFIGHYV